MSPYIDGFVFSVVLLFILISLAPLMENPPEVSGILEANSSRVESRWKLPSQWSEKNRPRNDDSTWMQMENML
jgi:hypothetical protein